MPWFLNCLSCFPITVMSTCCSTRQQRIRDTAHLCYYGLFFPFGKSDRLPAHQVKAWLSANDLANEADCAHGCLYRKICHQLGVISESFLQIETHIPSLLNFNKNRLPKSFQKRIGIASLILKITYCQVGGCMQFVIVSLSHITYTTDK